MYIKKKMCKKYANLEKHVLTTKKNVTIQT